MKNNNEWQLKCREIITHSDRIRNRGKKPFVISRSDLTDHIENFLKQGGKITILEPQSAYDIYLVNRKKMIAAELCDSGKVIHRDYPEGFFN